MSLRFLVDESTGAAVTDHLRQHGYDVLSVSDVLPQADDDSILRFAKSDQRIVVTNDKDFGDLVFRERNEHCGIILLRLLDMSAAVKNASALSVIERYGDQLEGAFCVADEQRSRLR